MQSPQFRRLTGAIVSVLVLLLLLLIGLTLIRFPLGAEREPGAALPDGVAARATSSAAQATEEAAATSTAASHAGLLPTFTPTPGPEPDDPAAVTTPQSGFGVTLQPTPTRRDPANPAANPAANPEEDAPPAEIAALPTREPGALPLPDPGTPPTAAVHFLANPNDVQAVLFAGSDLWAATFEGVRRWDVAAGTSVAFGLETELGSVRLTSAVNCPIEGFGLVFGSDAGLQIFDSEAESWRHIVSGGATIRHRDVTALACDAAQGVLAVGYGTHGVDIYRARQGRWYYTERSDQLAAQGVSALAIGPGGVVWVASRGALASVSATRVTDSGAASPLTGEAITALATDDSGALWVAAGDRLYRYISSTWEVYAADRVAGDFPRGLLADVQPAGSGRVWVAGTGGELCKFDADLQACSPYYASPAPSGEGGQAVTVSSLAVSSSGVVAVGTAQAGSRVLLRGQWLPLAVEGGFPAANRIFAAATDGDGFLYVASAGGVQQLDPAHTESARLIDLAETGAPPAVRTLVSSPRGGVWLGGLWASYFDGVTWSHYTQADGLAGDEVTAITEDARGRLWFGSPVGLSIWTGAEFITLTGADVLPNPDIRALAADASGVWIGSAGGGLYRFQDNQLQVLTAENVGLPGNMVHALLPAADGVLYVGTNAGLAQVVEGVVSVVASAPAQPIIALAASPDGSVWAATAGAGTWVLRDGVWQAVALEGPVLPATVRTIAIDLYGGAWLGADNGLVRLAPNAR